MKPVPKRIRRVRSRGRGLIVVTPSPVSEAESTQISKVLSHQMGRPVGVLRWVVERDA